MPFITMSAVLVALFKDKLLAFYFPPTLEITISDSLLHLHEVNAKDRKTGVEEKQAWLGVIIKNIGISSAKNVEAYFNGIKSASILDFGIYRSLPLEGSWVKETLIPSIPPDIEIRFNICCVTDTNPQEICFAFKWTPNALLGVTCTPNQPGFFEFEIVVFANNVRPVKRKVEMEYDGIYTNGLKIKKSSNE